MTKEEILNILSAEKTTNNWEYTVKYISVNTVMEIVDKAMEIYASQEKEKEAVEFGDYVRWRCNKIIPLDEAYKQYKEKTK